MESTCSWCNQKAPYLQDVKVKVLVFSNDRPVVAPLEKPVCKKCEQDLREYEESWEVLSR